MVLGVDDSSKQTTHFFYERIDRTGNLEFWGRRNVQSPFIGWIKRTDGLGFGVEGRAEQHNIHSQL